MEELIKRRMEPTRAKAQGSWAEYLSTLESVLRYAQDSAQCSILSVSEGSSGHGSSAP